MPTEPDKKKTGLSILLAIGKKKPTDEKPSYEKPDESEPTGETEGEKGMPEGLATGGNEEGAGENMIALPKGFKPPGDAMEGEPFTTTVRGKIVNGRLQVMALGDVPVGEEAETPEEEGAESPEEQGMEEETGTEEPQGPGMTASMPPARKKGGLIKGSYSMPQHRMDQMKSLKQKASDELAARKVFQRGR